MTLYMGIVLYAPSLALSAVTGLNFTGSVISIGENDADDAMAVILIPLKVWSAHSTQRWGA